VEIEHSRGVERSIGKYLAVELLMKCYGYRFIGWQVGGDTCLILPILVGFDRSLTRATASMGADLVTAFFNVQMPLFIPGVVSGALFALNTSFDEVVVVLFLGSAC